MIYFVIWYIVGLASFIYWFTKTCDLTVSTLPMAFIYGFLGPISFIIGFFIAGPNLNIFQKVLIKRRK